MDGKQAVSVSRQALSRMPYYLSYIKQLRAEGAASVSAPVIARALRLNEVQVRKDLAAISGGGGRPRTGYAVADLQRALEDFLGYNDTADAVLVGAGALGRALLNYEGFASYGLNIVAAFDSDPRVYGVQLGGKPVLPAEKLAGLCARMHIRIGILTVPAEAAQSVSDQLVQGGVLAIWNFAPVRLNVPAGILVQNENMASSLAVLSKHLKRSLSQQ